MKAQANTIKINQAEKRTTEILFAVFTPFHEDGSINWLRIPDLFQHCVKSGANGIFLNGTTGEFASLTIIERLKLVEAWISCREDNHASDFKIVVHVGSANLQEAAEMAKHAQELGASGVAMVASFYYRPKSLAALMEQCQYVAAAASNIPFYYYNIPSFTGVNFPLIDFFEMAVEQIPNFAGMKNSSSDMVDHQHCIHFAKEKYALYWGIDEAFMMLFSAGNKRFVGSTYNYMNFIYTSMVEAYNQGDWQTVLSLEADADAIHRIVLSSNNGIAVGKEIMRFMGVDCGQVRMPLKKVSKADSEILFHKLQTTALFSQILVNQ